MKTSTRAWLRTALVAALLTPFATADEQEEYKAKYQEKLTHEFIEFGGWITDYDAARAKAKAEGKFIFAYFSRSYAP